MKIFNYVILKQPTRWQPNPANLAAVDVAVSHMWQELAQLVPGFEPPNQEDSVVDYVDAVVARGTAEHK